MTPKQKQAQLVRIVQTWKKRLMMDHITIHLHLDEEPDNEDALASVTPSDLYDEADMNFRADWMDHSVERLNEIIVHELMHILFRDYAAAVRSVGVTGSLSFDVQRLWHDRCHDAEEGLVDRLAKRFVEMGGVVE